MTAQFDERTKAFNERYTRRRFNIPRSDRDLIEWFESQENPSQSLRLLCHLFREAYGPHADVHADGLMGDGYEKLSQFIDSGLQITPAGVAQQAEKPVEKRVVKPQKKAEQPKPEEPEPVDNPAPTEGSNVLSPDEFDLEAL